MEYENTWHNQNLILEEYVFSEANDKGKTHLESMEKGEM